MPRCGDTEQSGVIAQSGERGGGLDTASGQPHQRRDEIMSATTMQVYLDMAVAVVVARLEVESKCGLELGLDG